jgi:hypothetical protein
VAVVQLVVQLVAEEAMGGEHKPAAPRTARRLWESEHPAKQRICLKNPFYRECGSMVGFGGGGARRPAVPQFRLDLTDGQNWAEMSPANA